MKKIYNSLVMAFSMYSKLPMPIVEWSEENKAYAFALFPLVGAVEMAILLCAFWILSRMQGFVRIEIPIGIILTILPMLYTGGIHMDGFMDTCDALGSHADKERKLEIMKDSHVGAAAVLGAVFYILIYFLGMRQMQMKQLQTFGFALIAERAISVLCLLYFQGARKNGMAADFVQASKRSVSKGILFGFLILSMLGMALPEWKTAFGLSIYFACLTFLYVKKMRREIGGLTGDTSGFFLQVAEIGALWVVLILHSL